MITVVYAHVTPRKERERLAELPEVGGDAVISLETRNARRLEEDLTMAHLRRGPL